MPRTRPAGEGAPASMSELTAQSASAMAAAVRAGEVGAVELLEAHAARIAAIDPHINALVIGDLDRAREAARRAERERAHGGQLGPLHGVPFTVKECMEVGGLPLREASLLRPPERSGRDATTVARLRAAGAIPLGKTNISELASFPDTTNLVYGETRNPHDLARSASGSSGGEAAAVAAGMSPLGVGSDYGGSIRGPAHATGVVGLRPGRGAVPLAGHAPSRQPPGRALWSTIGPLARTVEDAALLLGVLRGDPDPAEPRSPEAAPKAVAVMRDHAGRPLAPECEEAVARAAGALADAGHDVDAAAPPRQADAERMFDEVTAAETRARIATLLRRSVEEAGDAGPAAREHQALLSPQLASQWEAVRGRRIDLDRYLEALSLRTELEREVDAWLDDHPILLGPVAAAPAHRLGALEGRLAGGAVPLFELYASCTYASALGLPAAAVPVLLTGEGLPVAVQVIGRRGREDEVLAIAGRLELELDALPPPASPTAALDPADAALDAADRRP